MKTPKHKRGKLSNQEKAARASRRAAKLKAAKMRSPQELSKILGVGINQTYTALAKGEIKGAFRFGERWLIPDAVIQRILYGEHCNAA